MGLRTETSPCISGDGAALAPWLMRWGSTGLVGLVFALITLGGLVRSEGAGLSCPDWPLCFGRVVPPMDYRVFLEWLHRLIAGTVSVVLFALAAWVFARPVLRRRLGRVFALAIGLLFAQVVLGGMTVMGLLHPKWVSSHLVVGVAFFGTLVWIASALSDEAPLAAPVAAIERDGTSAAAIDERACRARLRFLSHCAAAALFAQIFLGGLVSSSHAGLACSGFPTCNGQWLPPFEGLVRFQILHRAGAFVAALGLVALAWSGHRLAARVPVRARAKGALRAIPALLAVQIALGILGVLYQLPLLVGVAHLGVAAALFGSVMVTVYDFSA